MMEEVGQGAEDTDGTRQIEGAEWRNKRGSIQCDQADGRKREETKEVEKGCSGSGPNQEV